MSDRVASYGIDVALDPKDHTLKGSLTLTWVNRSGDTVPDAMFHLYPNAFAGNDTVFMKESKGRHRSYKAGDDGWGYIRVLGIEQVDAGGAAAPLAPTYPDEDRTVMKVSLGSPVPPGGTAVFKVRFEEKLPKVFARSGYAGDFVMAGQWFPKIGVYQEGRGWNCHPYHLNSEFFADFGVYDVSVTVPKAYTVGATGVLWREAQDGETKRLDFHAEDVHDFSWTASPAFVTATDKWEDVTIRILMQPGNAASIPRYIASIKKALDCYKAWIWKYPYPQITVVDPPANGMGAGGMEYPMLITSDASPFVPRSLLFPEMVTVHEFGHQYWYGMSANNEFEEAWLDEGINSYYEARILDAWFGPERSMLNGFLGISAGDFDVQRMGYLAMPDVDPMLLNSWEYLSNGTYSTMSYNKSAIVLKTLEGMLGTVKMDALMKAFFEEARFHHPTTEDFLAVVAREAGADKADLMRTLITGTATVDFEVVRARSTLKETPEGYDLTVDPPKLRGGRDVDVKAKSAKAPDKAEAKGGVEKAAEVPKEKDKVKEKVYLTEVVVHRKGDLVLPVEVLVTFEDGKTAHETWDGTGRYHKWTYSGAKVARVMVDPDGKLPLDLCRLNNGWAKEPDTRPAASFVGRVKTFVQGGLLLLLGAL